MRETPRTKPGPIALRAISVMERAKGVHEETTNWGRWIKVYLASVNIFSPAPWCLAFANKDYEKAAEDLGQPMPHDWPDTGYCPTFVNWARTENLIVPMKEAQRGDWLFIYFPLSRRHAHVAPVRGRYADVLLTVEGNSNNDGSREGKEVVFHNRDLAKLHPKSVIVRLP